MSYSKGPFWKKYIDRDVVLILRHGGGEIVGKLLSVNRDEMVLQRPDGRRLILFSEVVIGVAVEGWPGKAE